MKSPGILFLILLTFGLSIRILTADDTVLAPGPPILTREMVDRLQSVYEFLLEVKLSESQSARFRQGIGEYWAKHDQEGIQNTRDNLEYYGRNDELLSVRDSSQTMLVSSFRAEKDDPVSNVLTEAFDAAHPDRKQATRVMALSDLVGKWTRQNALLAGKSPDGRPVGGGFTDTGELQISGDGKYSLVKTHSHCSETGQCCTVTGSTETGTITLENAKLVFNVQSGTELVDDGCNPALNQQRTIPAGRNSFSWSLATNPDNLIPSLCWSTTSTEAVCYDKQ